MEFVVIGDLHYFRPSGDIREKMRAFRQDMERKRIRPEWICSLGDVIENQRGPSPVSGAEGVRQWTAALKDIGQVFPEVPFLIVPGNHDWYGNNTWFGGRPNLDRFWAPFMEKQLGSSLNGKLFASFRHGDVLCLLVNHVGMDAGQDAEQRKWLRKTLAAADANPAVRHVFAFGHCGLWNVNYFRFNENAELLPVFAESKKLRGYFAGHVHRNSLTVYRVPEKNPVLQAIVSGLFADGEGQVQEGRLLLLNPPESARGYAAIPPSCPAYCRVTVRDAEVRLRYEAIGGETLLDVVYSDPDSLRENKRVRPELRGDLPAKTVRLKLHLYPYFPERFLRSAGTPSVRFNGKDAGAVPGNASAWHVNHFRYTVELPPESLRLENTVEFTNPNREGWLVRDCQLEAVDADGISHFSELYPKLISVGDHRNIYLNFGLVHPESGVLHSSLEYNAPDEVIQDFPVDGPVRFRLKFRKQNSKEKN